GHGHSWGDGHPWAYGHPGPPGPPESYGWGPGMVLPMLGNLLWLAMLLIFVWTLLRWISPYIVPILADIFDLPGGENPPALEILRQRYAAGEIDAVTFE